MMASEILPRTQQKPHKDHGLQNAVEGTLTDHILSSTVQSLPAGSSLGSRGICYSSWWTQWSWRPCFYWEQEHLAWRHCLRIERTWCYICLARGEGVYWGIKTQWGFSILWLSLLTNSTLHFSCDNDKLILSIMFVCLSETVFSSSGWSPAHYVLEGDF